MTIRREEDELQAAVEAGLPDEELGKLARIVHRVSARSIATKLMGRNCSYKHACFLSSCPGAYLYNR